MKLLNKAKLNGKPVRIVIHWTSGWNKANSVDKEHYHILIEGDGNIVYGTHSIGANDSTSDGSYAAHCKGNNTKSIGISLCGMYKATMTNPGVAPINTTQWDALKKVLVELCQHYNISPSRSTLMFHSEVQAFLGIKQNGKWDIDYLPWNPNVRKYKIGDDLRAEIKKSLNTGFIDQTVGAVKSITQKDTTSKPRTAYVIYTDKLSNVFTSAAFLEDSNLWVEANFISQMLGWKKISFNKNIIGFWLPEEFYKAHNDEPIFEVSAVIRDSKGYVKVREILLLLDNLPNSYKWTWQEKSKSLNINEVTNG